MKLFINKIRNLIKLYSITLNQALIKKNLEFTDEECKSNFRISILNPKFC